MAKHDLLTRLARKTSRFTAPTFSFFHGAGCENFRSIRYGLNCVIKFSFCQRHFDHILGFSFYSSGMNDSDRKLCDPGHCKSNLTQGLRTRNGQLNVSSRMRVKTVELPPNRRTRTLSQFRKSNKASKEKKKSLHCRKIVIQLMMQRTKVQSLVTGKGK